MSADRGHPRRRSSREAWKPARRACRGATGARPRWPCGRCAQIVEEDATPPQALGHGEQVPAGVSVAMAAQTARAKSLAAGQSPSFAQIGVTTCKPLPPVVLQAAPDLPGAGDHLVERDVRRRIEVEDQASGPRTRTARRSKDAAPRRRSGSRPPGPRRHGPKTNAGPGSIQGPIQ